MNRRNLVAAVVLIGIQPAHTIAGRKESRGKRRKERRSHVRSAVDVAQVDAVLGPLAEMMWHGEDDDGLSVDKLASLIAGGQRVIVQCTNQAKLAERALNRAGIASRMINPFYAGPWDSAWGHTSLEVKVAGRWQVFDPTGNAQLVDQEGHGMDVSTACVTRPILTRPFASDPLWAWEGAPDDLAAYYERVFQIPVIHNAPLWRFHDAENRTRIERMGRSWRMASDKEWNKLIR